MLFSELPAAFEVFQTRFEQQILRDELLQCSTTHHYPEQRDDDRKYLNACVSLNLPSNTRPVLKETKNDALYRAHQRTPMEVLFPLLLSRERKPRGEK